MYKVAFLVPHIFMQDRFIKSQIFAPSKLAIELVNGLSRMFEITLFSPDIVSGAKVNQVHVDQGLLEDIVNQDLTTYLKTNPVGFISNTRQVLSELVSKCYSSAKKGEFDLIHVYMCEDEQALFFADLIDTPILFTHHDPYNLYSKYRACFPKRKNLNYISISHSQREEHPKLNYIANIYNAVDFTKYDYSTKQGKYFLYSGRITKNKGLHIAIKVCKELGEKLVIIGKNYSGRENTKYFKNEIEPHIDNKQIVYKGFISDKRSLNKYYKEAKALLFPINWNEPFGMVMIESNASGTPVIAYNIGAVNEVIENNVNGVKVNSYNELLNAIKNVDKLDRKNVRDYAKSRFDLVTMINEHTQLYNKIITESLVLKNKTI